MGRLSLVILLMYVLVFKCFAQKTNVNFIASNVENIAADNLGNLYLVSPEGQIKKLDSKLDSVGLFNNKRQLGNIDYIDVSNPLKILVFYKNFSTILVLDRFMNIKAVVDLRKQNILQTSAIALSFDNLVWVYDELENKVKKVDENGNVLFESTDLRLVFNDIKPIEKIIDSNGKLYLYNKTQGLMQFDYYGALKKKFSFLNYNQVCVQQEKFYGFKDSTIEISNINLLTTSSKSYPIIQGFSKIVLQGNKLYFVKNNQLYTTSIN